MFTSLRRILPALTVATVAFTTVPAATAQSQESSGQVNTAQIGQSVQNYFGESARLRSSDSVTNPGRVKNLTGSLMTTASGQPREDIARQAQEGGSRLITLGDSQGAGLNVPFTIDQRDCWIGHNTWPQRFADSIGIGPMDRINASCSGASLTSGGFELANQARDVDKKGHIGPRTELILIQLGINDSWGKSRANLIHSVTQCAFNISQGCETEAIAQGRAIDTDGVTAAAYVKRTSQVITYLKYYAPNARIAFVGYPEMTPQRGNELCLNVLGLPVVQPRGKVLVEFFEKLREAQMGAAKELGVEFVDIKTATSGHGPCTAQPWVTGILDFRSNPLGFPWHLSPVGEIVTANTVRAHLGL